MRARTRWGFVLLAAAALASAAFGMQRAAAATQGLTFSLATVGDYGGEPSLVSDANGVLYEATPSGGTVVYRSLDHGTMWTKVNTADASSGDDCLGVDQSNAVYLCNLAGSLSNAPLQADEFKSTDQGRTWNHGAGFAPSLPAVPCPPAPAPCLGLAPTTCGTSCSVFGVDRDWTDAAILPPATSTAQAEVVLMYHDFYGPSHIWVNISKDGGATFGPPVEVLSSPAVTAGAISGTLVAQGYTFCNTVPAGVGIVRPGNAHAGRIYVAWIASDPVEDATGCNITQMESFHTLWVSYSDDNGATWTPQLAYDAGIGHDASTPFAAFTLDNQGNPYFGFAAPGPGGNPATCAAESAAGTLQSDPQCQYNMYVVWSQDGVTWDGGGGTIPGSAATAYQVNPPGEVGTHFFPAIAAQQPGHVDVAYLYTNEILPTIADGKAAPGGCAGPGPGTGPIPTVTAPTVSPSPSITIPNVAPNDNPPTYPPACVWNLEAAQSVDLTKSPDQATWTTTRVTPAPMHVGDVCNLGIFCVNFTSNRNLLDFIQLAIDPTTGCMHIAYPDDNTVNKLRVANQTSGCLAVTAAASNVAGLSSRPSALPNTSTLSRRLGFAGAAASAWILGLLALGRRRRRHAP